MTVNAKSSLNYNQIIDRIQKGTQNIEIQLLDDFIDNPQKEIDEKILDLIKSKKCDIQVIHMPLCLNNDYEIEKKETKKVLEKVCQFAQNIAILEEHFVLIVVHIADAVLNLANYNMLNRLKNLVISCLDTYDKVELAFENTTNIELKDGNINFENPVIIRDNHFIFSNIEFAKFVNHERCGVVLDTCHLLMTKNLFENLEKFLDCKLNSQKIFKEAFKEAAPYIKLIHLNYAKKHGYEELHSLPFLKKDKKSIKYLNYLMKLYKKYNYNCMITLEINEENFVDAKNFEQSYKNLKKIIKEGKNEN